MAQRSSRWILHGWASLHPEVTPLRLAPEFTTAPGPNTTCTTTSMLINTIGQYLHASGFSLYIFEQVDTSKFWQSWDPFGGTEGVLLLLLFFKLEPLTIVLYTTSKKPVLNQLSYRTRFTKSPNQPLAFQITFQLQIWRLLESSVGETTCFNHVLICACTRMNIN
jgi:hypothetical protein